MGSSTILKIKCIITFYFRNEALNVLNYRPHYLTIIFIRIMRIKFNVLLCYHATYIYNSTFSMNLKYEFSPNFFFRFLGHNLSRS